LSLCPFSFGHCVVCSFRNIAFIPVYKPHTHKLYILRHCTGIVCMLVMR
jgi:hypothetical protein